ncbi:MAG: 50S ribosomal protein L28 [Candidatus Omnitrophota bacterium]
MSRRCHICSKGAITGNSITRRGKAKAEGGVGKKTTSTTKRAFLPNLQKRKVMIDGEIKRILVCTKCIKGGKLVFASRQSQVPNN